MFLPWSMMSMPQSGPERTLGFWVNRKVAHVDERYSWPVLPFTSARFMSALQPMALADVSPAKQWAVFPYTSATMDRDLRRKRGQRRRGRGLATLYQHAAHGRREPGFRRCGVGRRGGEPHRFRGPSFQRSGCSSSKAAKCSRPRRAPIRSPRRVVRKAKVRAVRRKPSFENPPRCSTPGASVARRGMWKCRTRSMCRARNAASPRTCSAPPK